MTFFEKELVHFLKAMGLAKEVVDSLYKFDFSRTKGLAFIHSMFVLFLLSCPSKRFRIPSVNTEPVAALTLAKNGDAQVTVGSEKRSGCSACNMRVL